MTKVLVAATSAVVRAGLESLIRTGSNLDVVGSAANVQSLMEQMEQIAPEVVLIDLERGDTFAPGLAALSGESNEPALILLIDQETDGVMVEALRQGARAILPRDALANEIVTAVQAAAAGLIVLHPTLTHSILPFLAALPTPGFNTVNEGLTPREIEVLSMLAEGAGNKNIARRLGISEHTVKFHVGSILSKLNASSRTEAVMIGVRQGVIML